MCCTWLRPGHLSVHVGDSSRRCEEIVKKISNSAFECDYYYYYWWRKVKKPQSWCPGPAKGPRFSPGAMLLMGSGGKAPWSWRFFFINLRHENFHFLALYPVSNSHSQNNKLMELILTLTSRGTNQATALVGVRGQSNLKLKFFSKSKVWKPPFSGFKKPLTRQCPWWG